MEAIKKQASKLREQVARQQQVEAILRQLGQIGHGGVMIDEGDVELHEKLQNLFKSTRAAKIARKLAEDCCKYGIENQDSAYPLARVASDFGTSHASMEDHRETMLGILGSQVSEPLRALTKGAPLEDARHLTYRYDRTRQEFEIQAAEVIRRQSKSRDISAEGALKLKSAEKKLKELKSSMLVLGREATDAMLSVEDQQQELTFKKLLTMVDAERSYHRNVIAILEKLHSEMIHEELVEDSLLRPETPSRDDKIPSPYNETVPVVSDISNSQCDENKSESYFIAKVIHPFDAQADGELGLEVDDYVIIRQVSSSNGWSEGECKGKAGWFPSAYVEKTNGVLANKLSRDDSPL
ncbi:hypothetical protein OROGR_005792 [Orobanche gracilis]